MLNRQELSRVRRMMEQRIAERSSRNLSDAGLDDTHDRARRL